MERMITRTAESSEEGEDDMWRAGGEKYGMGGEEVAHSIPDSASALWRIVSLTAANTSRMLEVSVACVRLGRVSTDFSTVVI